LKTIFALLTVGIFSISGLAQSSATDSEPSVQQQLEQSQSSYQVQYNSAVIDTLNKLSAHPRVVLLTEAYASSPSHASVQNNLSEEAVHRQWERSHPIFRNRYYAEVMDLLTKLSFHPHVTLLSEVSVSSLPSAGNEPLGLDVQV
jgi:hypothetical protein